MTFQLNEYNVSEKMHTTITLFSPMHSYIPPHITLSLILTMHTLLSPLSIRFLKSSQHLHPSTRSIITPQIPAWLPSPFHLRLAAASHTIVLTYAGPTRTCETARKVIRRRVITPRNAKAARWTIWRRRRRR